MKKIIVFFGLLLFIFLQLQAQQRTVAECTVTYAISSDSSINSTTSKTVKTVYIKGSDCRTDINSSSFSQTIFFDKNSGNAVVLREFGNNKIMTKLNKLQWLEKNKKFEGAVVNLIGDTKNILGYECKKATIETRDGSIVTVFYATAITPSVKEFEYQFKDVPGFVLEYETEEAGKNMRYIATKINLSPVQSSKFDVPSTGYRMLN
jgi:GLPGLI family protein